MSSILLPFGLLALLLVLCASLLIEKSSPGATGKILLAVGMSIRQHWPFLLASTLGFAVLPGVTALLWGFSAGAYLSGVFFVGSLSTIFFGGFGGQWVGPGAAERTRLDQEGALYLLIPCLVCTVLFFVLSQYFPFDGFSPWPER